VFHLILWIQVIFLFRKPTAMDKTSRAPMLRIGANVFGILCGTLGRQRAGKPLRHTATLLFRWQIEYLRKCRGRSEDS
jgi:hypothetical protein